MKAGTVSVIIPTYKRNNLIRRTIDSVLNQSYRNIEIIIVDDNDPENEYRISTEKLMEEYISDSRIKYIKHDKNSGGCAARNTGLNHSSGEYICFLDDDDVIYKEKLEKQVAFLEEHHEFGAVYCGRKVGNMVHMPEIEGNLSYYLLSGESIVVTIMLMFRRESIGEIQWNLKLKRNQEAGFMLDLMNQKSLRIGRISEVLCESNMEDRSNALNPEKNELEFINYLTSYVSVINRLKSEDEYAEKKIYTHRYKGIFLTYLKSGKMKCAVKAYFTGCKISFLLYNRFLFIYSMNRIVGKKKDYFAI